MTLEEAMDGVSGLLAVRSWPNDNLFNLQRRFFPNAACAVALFDRLTHHAEIISIDGRAGRKVIHSPLGK